MAAGNGVDRFEQYFIQLTNQNETIAEELRRLAHILDSHLEELIKVTAGKVPEGSIPLATHREHIEMYNRMFKFFGVVVLGIIGLFKFNPDMVSHLFGK